ncbi:S49 family peptidase [Tianweitania sediminis]|uniref:S49 family peptidase n=1 Tax=Tianweitania sediminis TaxID=1502156 RepID=A0A8J7RK37_9HYPH|nr:S49 family peptidase [Tianweitania sediminis]MBP0439916.1 S49 family peptidase [Tianweitania sediminis]
MPRFRKASFEHGRVWAITETALRSMLVSAAAQETSVDAIARQWGDQLEGAYSAEVHDGVAVIPVNGPLMRHLSFWSWISGSGAYELLAKEISAAVANGNVRAVVLDIDSPGGEVTGCGELAELIFRMHGEKPIVAYATGLCASAAYWIAFACDEVIVSPTSQVGSIGCVASIRDYRVAEE